MACRGSSMLWGNDQHLGIAAQPDEGAVVQVMQKVAVQKQTLPVPSCTPPDLAVRLPSPVSAAASCWPGPQAGSCSFDLQAFSSDADVMLLQLHPG